MDTKGIITKISRQNFSGTYRKLKETIDNNPNLGTPLMQSAQTLGLDLPQKVLVHENGSGVVHISYNDPEYLKNRHGISDADEILSKVALALDKITTAAADT